MVVIYHDADAGNPTRMAPEDSSSRKDASTHTTRGSPTGSGTPEVPFGRPMREKYFAFRPGYTPLNHGSYGMHPTPVSEAHSAVTAESEGCPDAFIALDWPGLLAEQRRLAAQMLNAPSVDEIVFVPNATTGTDTVLKNLVWESGRDVVVVYEVTYDSVLQGLQWLEDFRGVRVEVVKVGFPVSDDELVEKMVDAVRAVNSNANGKGERVRMAIVDSIVSMPGIRIPFERLVPALRAEGCLVHVDAAHGIGHVDIDLKTLDPDFLVTNLHKWFFVPRSAAVMFVPERNQGLIRTTLPTSHLYRGLPPAGRVERDTAGFVEMFDFTGTLDSTSYLCVKAAMDFRNRICGGEAAINAYCREVAREGAEAAAQVFGTDIMDCEGSCIRDCNLPNVRLPLPVAASASPTNTSSNDNVMRKREIDPATAADLVQWIKETGVAESNIYFQTVFYRGVFWWRLSGMIYVDVDDFRHGAEVLKELCERALEGEYL